MDHKGAHMASDDIAYERNESEDFLLAVPAATLTVGEIERMEPIVRHELEAYVARGGKAWTQTANAPTPLEWPPVIVVEVVEDEPSAPVKVSGKVKTEGAKVDG